MKLISYKMTDDTGFAPNPFFGVLTLATCKAGIRRSSTRVKGDWIAGFGSKKMCGDEVGKERLIFLMEVTEEPLPIENYYDLYPKKHPILPENLDDGVRDIQRGRRGCGGNCQVHTNISTDWRMIRGDNIYRLTGANPEEPNAYEVLPNISHPACRPDHRQRDVSGKNVLISNNFYYFGGAFEDTNGTTGLFVPEERRPNLAKGQSGYGTITQDDPIRLIEYIQYHFKKPGIYGRPFSWPENDESWKNDENYI